MAEKIIDTDRFWYNPETGEKKHSHYTDGTEIPGIDQKFKEECAKACTRRAHKEFALNPKQKLKPLERREVKQPEPVKISKKSHE